MREWRESETSALFVATPGQHSAPDLHLANQSTIGMIVGGGETKLGTSVTMVVPGGPASKVVDGKR